VFETQWDRRQLDACHDAWADRVELAFPPPDDVTCPSDFDVLGFIEAACSGAFGRIDAVASSSDYPGATVAASIATRLGLPGPRPAAVIGASHKYYSRLAQQRGAPEAVPAFALVDPRHPESPPPLPPPFFVKPVKGAFSVLARRIDSAEALRDFLDRPAIREFLDEYLSIFNRLVPALTDFPIDGRWFLAEELVVGRLVTVEGYACDGEAGILGIVDSTLDPATGSFLRFDYPSTLPREVQERMADVARRVVRALGLSRSLFNIEMTWDEASGRIAIIEVNPRICGQFADLYQKVDGTNSYEVLLALVLGEAPRIECGAGPDAAAASVPLRVFRPCRVTRAPDAVRVAQAEALWPGTLVWSECRADDVLADFDVDEDGASHRYAVVNLGGASRTEIDARLSAVRDRLDYVLEPPTDD